MADAPKRLIKPRGATWTEAEVEYTRCEAHDLYSAMGIVAGLEKAIAAAAVAAGTRFMNGDDRGAAALRDHVGELRKIIDEANLIECRVRYKYGLPGGAP